MTKPRELVALWWLPLLTLFYFVAGKFGLSLAFVHANASPVWPPTGIAFAAFLVLGSRAWPAILVGAFLVNVTTAGSVATSIGIAIGNTLEGHLGADLVRRFAHGRNVFDRSRDVFKFVLLAALFSTTVSATIGVTSLTLAGYAHWRDYGSIWFTWWLGDAVGALVVGPILVLGCARGGAPWSRARLLEGVGLLAVAVSVGALVFGIISGEPLTFLCVPPLIWAAFRFGQKGTATAIALLAVLATWGTVHGVGPFADGPPNESLLLLQAFLGTMAVMSLLITSWNAGAERLYGYSAGEAVGRQIAIIIPPDRPNEMLRVLARLQRGEHIEPFETVRSRKDASLVEVSVTVSPIRSSSGKVIGASTIAHDITEEKRAEAALREATALRSVASLALAAAHEINNPLTVVWGEIQLLARETGARWESRIAAMLEALERIRDVVARMNRINRLEQAEQLKNLPEMLDLNKSSGPSGQTGDRSGAPD